MDVTMSVITIGQVFARLLIGLYYIHSGRTVSEALGIFNEDSECRPHLTVNRDI
jgi:hypothetical protein